MIDFFFFLAGVKIRNERVREGRQVRFYKGREEWKEGNSSRQVGMAGVGGKGRLDRFKAVK